MEQNWTDSIHLSELFLFEFSCIQSISWRYNVALTVFPCCKNEERFRHKRPDKLLRENVSIQNCILVANQLTEMDIKTALHLSYRPDHVIFGSFLHWIREKRKKVVRKALNPFLREEFYEAFTECLGHYYKCIEVKGSYFEGDKNSELLWNQCLP